MIHFYFKKKKCSNHSIKLLSCNYVNVNYWNRLHCFFLINIWDHIKN